MFTLLSALCESLLTPEVNISLLSCKTLHCAPHPAANSVICAAVLSGFLCFHSLVACWVLMRELRSEPEQWSCRSEHLKMLTQVQVVILSTVNVTLKVFLASLVQPLVCQTCCVSEMHLDVWSCNFRSVIWVLCMYWNPYFSLLSFVLFLSLEVWWRS